MKHFGTKVLTVFVLFLEQIINFSGRESTSKTKVDEKEIKKATTSLLRTILVLVQTLRPLPDDVMLTMKLLYYDDGKFT